MGGTIKLEDSLAVNLDFDLDTGSSVSTIPEKLFREHFGDFELHRVAYTYIM